MAHPELRHVRARGKTLGHNDVRERTFEPLNYERLYREQNDDALDLVRQAVFVSSTFGTARVPSIMALLVGRMWVILGRSNEAPVTRRYRPPHRRIE